MNYTYGNTKVKVVSGWNNSNFEENVNDAIEEIEGDNGIVKDIKFQYDDAHYYGIIIYNKIE